MNIKKYSFVVLLFCCFAINNNFIASLERIESSYIDFDALQGDIFTENIIPMYQNNLQMTREQFISKSITKYKMIAFEWGKTIDLEIRNTLETAITQLATETRAIGDNLYTLIKLINNLLRINKNTTRSITKNKTLTKEYEKSLVTLNYCYGFFLKRYEIDDVAPKNQIIRLSQISAKEGTFFDSLHDWSALSSDDLCMHQQNRSDLYRESLAQYSLLEPYDAIIKNNDSFSFKLLNSLCKNFVKSFFLTKEKYELLGEGKTINIPLLNIETSSCKSKNIQISDTFFSLVNFSTNDFGTMVKIIFDNNGYLSEENKNNFFNAVYEWINDNRTHDSIILWFPGCLEPEFAEKLFEFIKEKSTLDVEMCF